MNAKLPQRRQSPLARIVFLALLLTLPQWWLNAADEDPPAAGSLWALNIDGVIGPASADYFLRNLNRAVESNAHLLLLRLDTPGGLDTSMREMIKAILSSPIPVVTYVEPGGARAASAGTYLLYASHVAAMAPATNLGAATPVQIGAPGLPETPQQPDQNGEAQDGEGEDAQPQAPVPGSAMERKIVNDAVAYIRSLAELRGRNADWAERAVREGASLAASKALENNVVDVIATDVADLKRQLHGRTVTIGQQQITLNTRDAPVIDHEPDWRSEFLEIITNPNVAYVLMLVGIYGLIFEFSNPGMGGPGIVGAVCLMLALYAFAVLPISYLGLGLIALGIALMVVEAFSPSFGVAGGGGLIAFIIGSIVLMDSELPAFQIALPVILAVAAATAGMLVFVLGMVLRARKQAVVSGPAALLGAEGTVESVHNGVPLVRVQGELWQARCDTDLQAGERVRVLSAEGLHLNVKKL